MVEHLFVYGSLRSAFDHPMAGALQRLAEPLGTATVTARLYRVDWYPGAVPGRGRHERVLGELFRMHGTDELLNLLDEYEGCPGGRACGGPFRRARTRVRHGEQAYRVAWIYWYDRPINGLERIHCGDYLAYQAR